MSQIHNADNSTVHRDPQVLAVARALSAPFEHREIKFKPQIVKNNRALAMAYIDARLIQDRLDEVLGVENWQDKYDILADGSVMCRLRLKLGGRWITKSDVGSPSEQPDSGDRLKAAFSDALKRAAVKFGIGRYLYRLPAQWVDYDQVKKQLSQLPQLPAFALPRKTAPATAAPSTVQKSAGNPLIKREDAPSRRDEKGIPASGQELHQRLRDYDARLASTKVCQPGALLAHVTQAGVKAGFAANIVEWNGPAISFAIDAVREFEHSIGACPRASSNVAA